MNEKGDEFSRQLGHEDLAEDFRQQIRSGILKPGQKMPSLSQLKLMFGMPQPAIIRAQDVLEREGLIVRRQGSGTFVSDRSAWFGQAESGRISLTSKSVMVLTSYQASSHARQYAPGWAIHTSFGIIQQCLENDLHAVLLKTSHVTSAEIDHIIDSRPFGMIVGDQRAEDIPFAERLWERPSGAQAPIVSVNDIHPEIDCVLSDQSAGAMLLADWLVKCGRQRILCILPAANNLSWISDRRAGYEASMAKNGLQSRVVQVPDGPLYVPSTDEEFEAEARRFLGYLAEHLIGPDPCDAIMAPTDGNVSAIARACKLVGKVPNEDVAIVGYDNYWREATERRWETVAPMATIDKNNQQIGRELVTLLLDRVEGRLPNVRQLRTLTPVLVVTSAEKV